MILENNLLKLVRSLSRNLLSVGIILPLGLGTNFLMNLVLARTMPVASFGVFSYVLTLANTIALGTSLGFSTSMMRFIPEYQIKNEFSLLNGLITISFKLIVISSILIGSILLLLSWLLPSENLYAQYFIYTSLLIIPLTIDVWRESSVRGLHQIAKAILPRQVLLPAIILCFTLLFKFSSENSLLVFYFFILFFLEIIALWQFWNLLPISAKTQPPLYETMFWLKTSIPMGVSGLIRLGINRWDILLVGTYLGMEEAGIYTAAAYISLLVSLAMRILNLVCGPLISQIYHNKQIQTLRLIMNFSISFGGIIGGFFLGFAFMFSDNILSFFGEGYQKADTALKILAVGQFINLITGPASLLLLMAGYERSESSAVLLSGILSIILGVILIPQYGINGAAITTAITISIGRIFIYIKYKSLIFRLGQNL
ncbi:oligosaccharide flippase family protein [Candidatus Nitrosacidococcus sp. I8]|uniref:oligosaccharide flippase family protein n=1 Tax=Candidatus Nitrosacidococcus sp. I8 TaxID=2942908 RepID=UPI00222634CE|nr:oligosaccharide flippase family protein [Candidatus Nitrosacidococcus sp. I8]CAH9018343.1 hypothetical protein NURINAE_00871 [Candidatus Nitrosacidococcus sp. I8]